VVTTKFGLAAEASIRFGLSESLVYGVNINDARATMVVWIKRISDDIKLDIDFDPRVFDTTEQLQKKIRAGAVDAVVMSVLEYRPVAQFLDTTQLVTETGGADLRYVLLVPVQGGPQHFKELQGKRLTLLDGRIANLVPYWLRTLTGTEPPERFFASITPGLKASQVILPVFFGKADACITTSRSFQTMSEMNPQVGKRLRVLETSPELVGTFYIFRKGFQGARRERVTAQLLNLKNSPSGRQMMTLFQFSDLRVRDFSCLNETLRMIEAAERLQAAGRR
jgi:phosphonate transport system substrate-binding protein